MCQTCSSHGLQKHQLLQEYGRQHCGKPASLAHVSTSAMGPNQTSHTHEFWLTMQPTTPWLVLPRNLIHNLCSLWSWNATIHIVMWIMAGKNIFTTKWGLTYSKNHTSKSKCHRHQNHNATNIKITIRQGAHAVCSLLGSPTTTESEMFMKKQYSWWVCSHKQLQWNKDVKKTTSNYEKSTTCLWLTSTMSLINMFQKTMIISW